MSLPVGPALRSDQLGDADGIVGAMEEIAGGVGHLVTRHLLLARVELTRDARACGIEIGRMTLFLPIAAVGFGFVSAALALVLARWFGGVVAVAMVGVLDLGVGGVGLYRAARRLLAQKPLRDTLEVLGAH